MVAIKIQKNLYLVFQISGNFHQWPRYSRQVRFSFIINGIGYLLSRTHNNWLNWHPQSRDFNRCFIKHVRHATIVVGASIKVWSHFTSPIIFNLSTYRDHTAFVVGEWWRNNNTEEKNKAAVIETWLGTSSEVGSLGMNIFDPSIIFFFSLIFSCGGGKKDNEADV